MRCGIAAALPVERSRAASAASTAASAAASASSSSARMAMSSCSGDACSVGGQAHVGGELEVERRGHGDEDGGDAVPGRRCRG